MRFYTYPPKPYDYVMRNIKQPSRKYAKHEIVDIGIYDLLKDPHEYSDEKLNKFVELKTDGWKVVPDYPDIFKEHGLDSMGIDNVEKSKELMKKYYNPDDISHLPVVQGHYNDPDSFDDYSRWILDNYPMPAKIGVGTVCKSSNKKTTLRTLQIARKNFPDAWIHAFGLTPRYLTDVHECVNSFDTMSWTFPTAQIRGKGQPSARNTAEKLEYFDEFVSLLQIKFDTIKSQQSLGGYF